MIFHCLRHWVHNYHVDGFRFDLASILSRDRSGNLVPNPPLVEAIGEDPLLADTKIIAEAWDAAGAYQVGSFGDDRWAEWNGRYRDDVRRYWRGDRGMRGAMATRLSGSADLYQPGGRHPACSINFITSHDGFTLNDLVTYRDKHNLANGEDNRDGENNNYSSNFGVEGPTEQKQIDAIRVAQIKNMLATLMLSQGVPMIVAGDEFRRTQKGNNNAYCQDNEVSWIDWSLLENNAGLNRFCRTLIEFRRNQPAVRRRNFLTGHSHNFDDLPDVSWFSALGTAVDWQSLDLPMICVLTAPVSETTRRPTGCDVLIMFNSSNHGCQFAIPTMSKIKRWRKFLDTATESPDDIYPNLNGPSLPITGCYTLPGKSMAVFVSDRTDPETVPSRT
jgi:glycogen operon protein